LLNSEEDEQWPQNINANANVVKIASADRKDVPASAKAIPPNANAHASVANNATVELKVESRFLHARKNCSGGL
jgi:hypothetical protein